MKKIVLNMNDSSYEKFCFEAIHEKKNIQQIIYDRVFHKPFHSDVEQAFDDWLNSEVEKIIGGK